MTAKLSKRFYDVLGEDVANELVDWFNAVDLTYRAVSTVLMLGGLMLALKGP